jgi:hypothetical protein
MTETTATTVAILTSLLEGYSCPVERLESLTLAIELGADAATLELLRDATRVSRRDTIVLPALRYESLSRGRGWARQGRGSKVTWGERVSRGYEVGPGSWTVGATDGFSRKDACDWTVKHVTVGTAIWTVAQ